MKKSTKSIFGLLMGGALSVSAAAQQKPNVLFIAVDDLRPDLGCYKMSATEQVNGPRLPVHTPNMDRIASEGIVFERAYCQQAVCGPSRLSLMTGTHPDRFGIYGMTKRVEWRDKNPGLISLPQQFREHGWKAVGFGKIYDDRLGLDREHSWDDFTPGWKDPFGSAGKHAVDKRWRQQSQQGKKPDVRMSPTECVDVPDDVYTDGHVADLALKFLDSQDGKQPFFLAVGFTKPHLPFVAPKKYWDLYKRSDLPLASINVPPEDCTPYTISDYKELQDAYEAPVQVPPEMARELVHGYLACISYVDAQIGKLAAKLKERGLYDNTIIVLWGDHGWKLGDYGEWGKCTNLEVDTRVPLIFRLPAGGVRGMHTTSLAEFTDIFPTLCEAAGIPIPDTVEGCSQLPVLLGSAGKVRDYALSQYPRMGTMGYSLRTDRWRYTEWRTPEGEIKSRELYDLENNPAERRNVALENPAAEAGQAALLKRVLTSLGERRPK